MKKRALLTPIILGVITPASLAAGFQANEHSASGLGRAFSGEGAVADNASVLARNPAAMTLFDNAQFSGAITLVDPNVNITDETNNQQMKDVAPMQFVPGAYYISPINEQWAWGIGLFSTYGVATDYPDNAYAGDLAGDTSLISVNLNPNIAYRINDQFSLGAGVNFVYAEAELNRHKGALAPFLGGSASDMLISMKGETYAFGWNLGALYEVNDNHRFGFSYRSAIDLAFEDGDFSSYDSGISTPPNTKADLDVTLPAIWEFSGYHKVAEKWAIHYGLQRTEWSSFKELKATSPTCAGGSVPGECFYKKENYEDSNRYSAGFTHYLTHDWTLRAGFALDKQAGEATLSIPDSDRYWYSAGITYQMSSALSVDAGLTFLQGKSGSFTEVDKLGQELQFSGDSTAYIGALQVNYQFN
ncbi:outer membrane protein transport protein [Vibrio methylphosphonaticus]|uniref:outer membrane protein transport protein n=1 Tax=Vibrio methylphosphonaticus TaxID=2946866 RepID=UPI002029D319|nr:outer membrane protein transport protein [Vibrio methylphosphonaticus]MCL9776627.1 outer membrane protein transport protein [Vibrio methylphosphonaticus]